MLRCEAGKAVFKTNEWRTKPKMRYERKSGVFIRSTAAAIRSAGASAKELNLAEIIPCWPRLLKDGDAKAKLPTASLEGDLSSLSALQPGWDDGNAEVPTKQTIEAIERALGKLFVMGARPAAIRASSEGGAGICFSSEHGYGHIEFLNNHEIYGLAYSAGRDPESWQINDIDTDLRESLDRIRAHVQP